MKTNNQNKSEPQQSSEESIWDNYQAPATYDTEKLKTWYEEQLDSVEKSNHSGIFEQIRQGNIHSYKNLTEKDLREALEGMFKKE